MSTPYYVRDYQRLVRRLLADHSDRNEAMSQAVGGGSFNNMGAALAGIVVRSGIKTGDYLVDVGCGSGRLARALQELNLSIQYLGIDVVQDLLEYAQEGCQQASWRFLPVEGTYIPEVSGIADIVVFFSVLTHLGHRERLAYLLEAKRVLKPAGAIIFSYIDPKRMQPRALLRFCLSYGFHHLWGRGLKSVAFTDAEVRRLAVRVGMRAEFLGPIIGQSVCIFRRPLDVSRYSSESGF